MESSTITVILAVLILMSAYFSATETAFSSFNRIRMKNLASGGNKRAQLVLALADDYDRILSTILIGNNIVNIASASLATTLFVKHYGEIGVTLSTIVMTILVLLFGEISPKSLAKESPEKFTMLSAPILKGCVYVLMPINFFFMIWRKLLSLVIKPSQESGITEEELLTIIEEAQQDGGIEPEDSTLIKSALEFNDLEVEDILIPRVDIVAIADVSTQEEIAALFKESNYSRLPVYKESIDKIVGVLHQKDFNTHSGEIFDIYALMKETLYITGTMKIYNLLKGLQQTKSHLAIVTDEYGGTRGIVTLEDILEELVGEIWDEHDEIIEEIQPLTEGSYRVAGTAKVSKVLHLFAIENDSEATIMSKWIINHLDKIPNEGDHFDFRGLHIVVVKTDHRRIVEVTVEKVA